MKKSVTAEIQALSAVIEVKKENFEEIVLKNELPVVVDFSAEWCPPCRVLAPLYARLSQEYLGKVVFASIDTEVFPEVLAALGVQGIPTLIIFHHGQELRRLVGPHPARLQATLAHEFGQHHLL